VQNLEALLRNPRVTTTDALKLVLLYCLRYETSSSNASAALMDSLAHRGVPHDQLVVCCLCLCFSLSLSLALTPAQLVDALLRYAGSHARSGDLFGAKSLLAQFGRQLARGIKGVDNVLIQHVPYMTDVLKSLITGKLSDKAFPAEGGTVSRDRPLEIIVYFTGGVTFEEAVAADRFMHENPGVTVVLGGSTIHNSASFLADVRRFAMSAR
jgi:vacuolar protein sorting-associated protein 45